MQAIRTDKDLPKLKDKIWKIAECYKRAGEVEESRESDYVLVFYKNMWCPAMLRQLKFTGKPQYEYSWFILTTVSWYTDFDKVKFWIPMLEAPTE